MNNVGYMVLTKFVKFGTVWKHTRVYSDYAFSTGMWVGMDTNPITGRIHVAATDYAIYEFEANGTYVGNCSTIPNGQTDYSGSWQPQGVAVDNNGNICYTATYQRWVNASYKYYENVLIQEPRRHCYLRKWRARQHHLKQHSAKRTVCPERDGHRQDSWLSLHGNERLLFVFYAEHRLGD